MTDKSPRKTLYYILVFFSCLLFALPMMRSGWITGDGLRLIGVNNKDGLWNLALIEELKHHFPPDHPAFAGLPLTAYHFLYHLTLAAVSMLTGISTITLYFHIAPVIIALAWGFGVYWFVYERFGHKSAAWWSVFLSFFGGSFAWIFHVLGHSELSLDSAFGIAQPYGSSMVNPAFASSIALLIWSLVGLQRYKKTKNIRWLAVVIICSGVSVGFKTYAGMIMMGALAVVAIWELVLHRKVAMLIVFGIAVAMSLGVFLPFSGNYGFLTYAPLWPLHRLMQGTLNYTRWDELWDIHQGNLNTWGIIKLELWAFTLFFFGNVGSRIIAVIPFIAWFKKGTPNFVKKIFRLSSVDIYLLMMIVISFIIPLFFLQPTGGGFNMIQMYWYFLFLLSLVAGYGLMKLQLLIRSRLFRWSVIVGFVAITIPSNNAVLFGDLMSSGSHIDLDTFALFKHLQQVKSYDSTVLEIPMLNDYSARTLTDWFNASTPIIPAFAGKRAYIANEVVSFPYEDKEKRLYIVEQIMRPYKLCPTDISQSDECKTLMKETLALLRKEKIMYILAWGDISWLDNWDHIKVLLNNSKGKIYEVLPL